MAATSLKSENILQVLHPNPALCIANQLALYFCETCNAECSKRLSLFWIECDICNSWYCFSCENLNNEPQSDVYLVVK